MTTPGQYGGAGGPDGPTRPVNPPGGFPQQGPSGTRYAPTPGGGYPGPGPLPPPGQYGTQGGGDQGGWPQQGGGDQGGWPQQGGGWPGPGPGQYPPFQPPGGRPPGSSSTGMVIGIVVAVVVLLGGGSAWFFLAGPGAGGGGRTTASGPPAAAPAPPAAPAPTSAPVDAGDVGSVDVEVGECVALGGTATSATAEEASCGSQEANYVVNAKTENSDQCAQDSDQWFYETRDGVQQGALCLDIDWVEGDCFDLSAVVAERVACSTPGLQTVRVGETVQGATDDSACDRGQRAFTYDERGFAVCLEQL